MLNMNKKAVGIGISLIVTLLVGLTFFLATSFLTIVDDSVAGFTVTSISPNIEYDFLGQVDIGNSFYLIYLTLDAGGENIVGTLTVDEIEGLSGISPEKDLRIVLYNYTEYFTYNADNSDPVPIYNYHMDVISKTCILCPSITSVCAGYDYSFRDWIEPWFKTDYYCISKQVIGYKANVVEGNKQYDIWVGIEVDGQEEIIHLQEEESKLIIVDGEVVGSIEWVTLGTSIHPEPSVIDVYASRSTISTEKYNVWHFGKREDFNLYTTRNEVLSIELSKVEGKTFRDPYDIIQFDDGIYEFFNELISLSNAKAQNFIFDLQEPSNGKIIQVNLDGVELDSFIIEPLQKVYNPQYVLLIEADWIGVEVLVGYPQIQKIEPTTLEYNSGSSIDAIVTLTVKNIGDGALHGQLFITCDNTYFIKSWEDADALIIAPGQTNNIQFKMSESGLDANIETNCIASIRDENYPDNEDSIPFIIILEEALICTDGDMLEDFISNKIYICQDNAWVLYKYCEFGLTFNSDTGEWDCLPEKDEQECPVNQTLCADETCQKICTGYHNCPIKKVFFNLIETPNIRCMIQVWLQENLGRLIATIVLMVFTFIALVFNLPQKALAWIVMKVRKK